MSLLKLHYASLEQRVAVTFLNGLIKEQPEDASRHDLHRFFYTLYQALYESPEQFGFKIQEDEYLLEHEEGEKEHKQDLARKMKKSRNVIVKTLELLMHIGKNGTIEDNVLTMEKDEMLKKAFRSRNQKKFFTGMAVLGFTFTDDGEQVTFHSESTPNMLPALQALAKVCVEHEDPRVGLFNFWRCDFNALETPNFTPPIEDLYALLMEDDRKRLLELHAYFIEHGYDPEAFIYDTKWDIKYQGDRKIKSTPLYQITYEDRYINPLRVNIRPVSTGRLKELIPAQSTALQTDFSNRAYPCRGDECGWCYSKKTLGPSTISFNGESRVVCWYTNPMVTPFTDESVPLVKEYEQMHARLGEG